MVGRGSLLLVSLLLVANVDVAAGLDLQKTSRLETQQEAITIDAESMSYDQKTDTMTATGKVVIRRGETELRADRVELNRSTGEAVASGAVTLTDPDGSLSADQMRINLQDETGELNMGEIHIHRRNHYSLWGDRIVKGVGQSYHIENGKFTTCDCGNSAPDWSFGGRQFDIDADGYGVVDDGRFNVLDVPVLLLPKAALPVGTERQSGLLIPQVGVSNLRGFQLVLPAYLAIDRSQDASLSFDTETSARLGALGQYRYALNQDTHGEINGAYFNDFLTAPGKEQVNPEFDDQNVPENRWSVIGSHRQILPAWNTVAYADVFAVSDDSYLRDMNLLTVDHSVGDFNRTRRYTDSLVGAATDLDNTLVQLQGDYYQGFTQPQDLTLQKVPELEIWDQRELGGVVESSTNASASSWVRSTGIQGFRVDLWPRFTLPIPTGGLPLHASTFVGLRETAYSLTQNEMRGGLNPNSTANFILDLPSQSSRQMIEAGGEVGTEISNVYDVSLGDLQKLKHTIEPMLTYWYVPEVNQDDLPIFDDVDRMDKRNLITYGVVSRLLGRFREDDSAKKSEEQLPGAPATSSSGVRELLWVSITQSYDPSRIIAPVGEPPGSPSGDHLSDIDLFLHANPIEAVAFSGYTSYDTSADDIAAASATLRLTDTRTAPRKGRLDNRSSIALNYRFVTRNILQEVDAYALLHLTDYIGALGGARYDVLNGEFLESRFGIRLLSVQDCWGLDVTFVDKTSPHEVEVRALLTLAGFGSTGT